MTVKIIDGKCVAAGFIEEAKKQTSILKASGVTPGLAVVLVGNDPASQIYVNLKAKACQEVGINSQVLRLPAHTTEKELLQLLRELNNQADVHGILVQLPLPGQIRTQEVIKAISPLKDVDGFHPVNTGLLWEGNPRFVPCTPLGCLKLLDAYGCELAGKHAVVVGRSNIVGKPMVALLLQRNATVSVCHSHTKDLYVITRQADVLIAAAGQPHLLGAEAVKSGAFVLDVGTNRLPSGKLVGDVDFEGVREKAGYLSPVPGGVGPLTIAMLLLNTIKAVKYRDE